MKRWPAFAAVLIVAAITFATFHETLGHAFVNWDDDVYVYENPAFRALSPQSIGWLFSHFYYFAYIPVTLLSHAMDVLAWGMNPRGHHLTNVLLHTANAVWVLALGVLLIRFAKRRPGRPPSTPTAGASALFGMGAAAVLFAVHPLRAESVSWISDRKDLLCTFFLLPSVMAYVVHATRSGAGRGFWLWASFLLFVPAVLSKSIAVTLPAVLFLLDWLGGRRGRGLILEKVPFLLVSLTVTALSLAMTPDSRPAYAVSHLTGLEAFLFPFYSLSFALYKTLLPIHLGPIYPRAGVEWMIAGLALVVSVTAAAIVWARKGRKGALIAWLVYLLLLLPNVAGLSTGMQPVADRYSYLSTIALYLLLGAAIAAAWERVGAKIALVAGAGGLAVLLAGLTFAQAAHWRSSISLWEYVVTRFPAHRDYTDAYLNLGVSYNEARRRAEARAVLEKAAALDPSNAKVHYNLGMVSYFEGDRPKALLCLRKATDLDPLDARAHYNRAIVSDELGWNDESVTAMLRAARLGWKDAQEALTTRGIRW